MFPEAQVHTVAPARLLPDWGCFTIVEVCSLTDQARVH